MRLPVETLIASYQQNLFRLAYAILNNKADADDAVQEAFIRYHQSTQEFEDEDHIRAWLLRVTANKARDIHRSFFRRHKTSLESCLPYVESLSFEQPEDRTLFETVMQMPAKYRSVLQLYYYEGYKTAEIARILSISESNVKTRLNRARKHLKQILEEEWDNE